MMFLYTRSNARPAAETRLSPPDLLALFMLLQLSTVQVFAAVYPTQPTANTVYTSGQLAEFTWKDDGRAPHLQDSGLMAIDLYASAGGSATSPEFYVAPLAKGVPPITRSYTAVVPQNLPSNASFYTLHFKFSSPRHSHWYLHAHSSPHLHPHKPEMIYTADFRIITPVTQATDSTSNADPFPIYSLLLPQSQSGLAAAPTPTASGEFTPETTQDDSSSEDHDQKDTQARAKVKNGTGRAGRTRNTKFRLLFIFWPALVGVSMAL